MIIGIKDAARLLGMSTTSIRAACVNGTLPAHKVADTWQVESSDVAAILKRGGLAEGASSYYSRKTRVVIERRVSRYLWVQIISRSMPIHEAATHARDLADELGVAHRIREVGTGRSAQGFLRVFEPTEADHEEENAD